MTTATPPFTGSYAVGLQGINVSRFDLFGISVAPKMGRNGMRTLISSSLEVIDVSPDTRTFFDDSLRLPQPISAQMILGVSSSVVEVISEDNYKLQQLPSYRLSRPTFGLEQDTDSSKPFHEMNSFDPVIYLQDPTAVAYPLVIEVPNAVDPFDYSGAIEPFVIRKIIAGNSTFVGSADDPEPTGIRGAVSAGDLQLNRRSEALLANNFYSVAKTIPAYFDEFGLDPAEEVFDDSSFSLEIPFGSNSTGSILPFTDRTSLQIAFEYVTNIEVRDTLISSSKESGKVDIQTGYPGNMFKSVPCGFEYQNSRGIDSIAYGGLLK